MGTLAIDGQVSEEILAVLKSIQESGRRLIMVTVRQLEDLRQIFAKDERYILPT